jgi:hypothetical protein
MIRSTLLSVSIFLVSTSLLANEVICTPTIPGHLDPHQSQFPVEEYISSLAYKTIESVVEKFESADQLSWKLKIRKNLKFNPIENWRPVRNLDSSDVVFSINRQLTSGAVTQFDVKTFNRPKYNGLEKTLSSIKAVSPDEVALTFNRKTTQEELNTYLAPPVGYILSKEFYDYKTKLGQKIKFHPSSTNLVFSEIAINKITLTPSEELAKPVKKGTFVFKGFKSQDADLNLVKEAGCRRVYFGGKKLTDELTKRNRRFRKQVVSRTKVFLELNSKLKIPTAHLLELRWLVSPEKLTSIKGMEISNGLFNNSQPFVFAGKQIPAKTEVNVKDFISCEIPQLSAKNIQLVNELKKIVGRSLKYKIHGVSTEACEILTAYTDTSTTIASLNSFTYKNNAELRQAFGCDNLTRKPFGFCVPGKIPQEKEIEAENLKFMRVFPLLDIENYFIYIF